jgi:hypothetical protein
MSHLLGILLATALTLAIFSRVWRANPGYQAAQHLLLGALTGYVAAVLLRTTLIPALTGQLQNGPSGWLMLLLTILLILLLGMRFTGKSHLRAAGLIPLALLIGAGSALALAGALRGTLTPQILAAIDLHFLPASPGFDALAVILATVITISVILFFHYRTQPASETSPGWLLALIKLGYWGVMIAAGALLATTAGARITLLIDRITYLTEIWGHLLSGNW